MCVIIDRQPGVIIPSAMLDIACEINAHGWGIAFADKKKLHIEYSSKNPNDAKEVSDKLQSLSKHRVFLHLRHATVGAINQNNQHPFQVLHKKKHGVDLAFMHNGTLTDYKPADDKDTKSDSFVFNDNFMRPLALRFNKWSNHAVLTDPLFHRVLKSEVGFSGTLFLFDGLGNVHIVNQQHGKEYEGWWASNSYSFQTSHLRYNRGKSAAETIWPEYNYNRDNYNRADNDFDDVPFAVRSVDKSNKGTYTTWEQDLKQQDLKKYSTANAVSVSDTTRIRYESGLVGEKIRGKPKMTQVSTLKDLKVLKTPFIEQAGIKSLDEVAFLSEADLIEVARDYPNAVARLLIDLLHDRQRLALANRQQASTILDLTKDKPGETK